MPLVVITGASGGLGRRIVQRLADDGKWSVVAIDAQPFPSGVAKPRHFTAHRVNLASAPLEQLLAGADAVIHLATTGAVGPGVVERDVAVLERTLRAADIAGVNQLLVLSSAAVYGAHSDNPVPLTEGAPLRPNADFQYAMQKHAVEAVANTWRESGVSSGTQRGGRTGEKIVAVLRPATTLGHPDSRAWLADSTYPNLAERLTMTLPASQFVHVDDLADAIVHAFEMRLDGTYNVSSSNWLSSEEAHALFGPNLGMAIPDRVAGLLRSLAIRLSRNRPEGASEYVRNPWVMASDKLMSTGWVPKSSSAEAFVAAKPSSVFARLYARRRQEMNLAFLVAGATSGTGLAAVAFRWWRRRWLGRSTSIS